MGKAGLAERLDAISRDLIGIKATVMTTYALLSHRGDVDGEVAINLMRGAINPLYSALKLVDDLALSAEASKGKQS